MYVITVITGPEDRAGRSPHPETPRTRMNLLRSPGFHPWTQDRQGTLKSKKPISNFERLLRDQRPKIAKVPWLIQIAFFPGSLGHPGRVPNQGQDRQGTLPGGTLDLSLRSDCSFAEVSLAEVSLA